ncbi:hypothetical protein CDEST_05940 [Colletotrichum destructivum]|uniref:Uncharacterized protein n=1 Tax=Colletotrichum destructivum TaxID=34406 RepID=A0AAX4ICS6_9PEZI|nr:hypothetical protein CDEST_05940 [Colletotrichum destructivum]
MAAPSSKTVTDLNGTWVLELTIPKQGMSWINRKVLSLGRITLRMTQKRKESIPSSAAIEGYGGGIYEVRQLQTVNPGGFTAEDVYLLDGEMRESTVPIWGRVASRLRMCGSRTEVENIDMFKDGGGGDNARAAEGAVIEEKTVSIGGGGWTSMLVWGFEEVAGERRFTQCCLTVKGETRQQASIVYDYVA